MPSHGIRKPRGWLVPAVLAAAVLFVVIKRQQLLNASLGPAPAAALPASMPRSEWTSAELGVFPHHIPGELSSGEHVVLHLFLKAVRLNGTVAVRGAGWAESADRVHYHALHLEFLRQPGDIVRDALQRKFLYLREARASGREHEFRVEEHVPDHDQPDNIVRPLTFSLAFDGEPEKDVFELRISGWRKYVVVALSDMLAVTDALAAAEEPLPSGSDPANPRYFVSVSPFFGVSGPVAAQMAHWHIAHYLRLGWSGHTMYLNREYLAAFREHPSLAHWIAQKRLVLIVWDSVGMPRISIGDDWGSPANRMGNFSRLEERVYGLQSTVYAHSLLAFWTGTRSNYVGLFDVDEYFVIDTAGSSVQRIGKDCFDGAAEVHVERFGTTCTDEAAAGACGVVENRGRWFTEADGLTHPIQRFTRTSMYSNVGFYKAIILAGFTHSMHVHDSIVSEGEKLMGYLLDRPQCQAYILHVHSLWKSGWNFDHDPRNVTWMWMYDSPQPDVPATTR